MTDQTTETARALLYRHGLPEDVIDGALCLHAQELAAVQRRDAAVWGVDTAAGKHVLATADLIDPTRGAAPVVPLPSVDQTALRDRIAAAVHPLLMDTLPEVIAAARAREAADVVLAVLPAPVDRAAVLREAADALERRRCSPESVDVVLRLIDERLCNTCKGYGQTATPTEDGGFVRRCRDCDGKGLRRVADETAATATVHQPRRGDQFEAWLKAQRDDWASDRADVPATYDALDDLLDLYRLHADTGTPLGRHVCEARVVGDCECLEQPAAGARQNRPPATAYSDGKGRTYCIRCAPAVSADVPLTANDVEPHELCPSCGRHVVDVAAAGARQDGGQK
ncbi:hypothetical protein [Streptomyces ardesiacus]|uniref:hypothetical protein n=1 Tax=Streptomyces ardesiacus TaxID=285564 RepID=UPI003F4A4E92